MHRRRPLRPEDFKQSQSNLLHQATQLDQYVSAQRQAGEQSRRATGWLVSQQALAQEAADAAADLAGLAQGSPQLRQLLLLHGQETSLEAGSQQWTDKVVAGQSAVANADQEHFKLLRGAESLALAVARLLEAASSHSMPLQRATVDEVQRHITALQHELAVAGERMTAAGIELGAEARRHALAVTPAAGIEDAQHAGLVAMVGALCSSSEYGLADAEAGLQLQAEAKQLEAEFVLRQARCAAALAAFIKGSSCGTAVGSSSAAGASLAEWGGQGQQAQVASFSAFSKEAVTGDIIACTSSSLERGASCSELLLLHEGSLRVGSEGSKEDTGSIGSAAVLREPLQLGACSWGEEERAAFPRLLQDCMIEAEECKTLGQAAVLERLQQRLPHRTEMQLKEYWTWHREASRMRNDLAQLQKGWWEEAKAFLNAAEALLRESVAETLQCAEGAAAAVEREVATLQRAQAMGVQQWARAATLAHHAQQAEEKAAIQAAQQEAQRVQMEQYRARMKELLAQHREAQREHQAEAQARQEAQAAARRHQAAAEAAMNQQRIEYRRERLSKKERAAQAAEREREEEALRREAALDRLRAKVAPTAQRDPERVAAPTAASKAGGGPGRQCAAAAFRSLFGNSYTTDEIIQDQRFKVFEALRALNLHSFEYAREAATRARPAKPPRTDNLTTTQRMLGKG